MRFLTRPHFENRQIVQWSGETISLSGQTYINNNGYIHIDGPLLDFTGSTSASTQYVIAGVSGYVNFGEPSSFIVQPPIILQSGSTATTTVNVTGYVLGGLDAIGRVTWYPASVLFSGITSPYIYGTNDGDIIPLSGSNITSSNYSIILGGESNLISGTTYTSEASTIINGVSNFINNSRYSLIGGGSNLIIKDIGFSEYNSIVNGSNNIIYQESDGSDNFIGGGQANSISGISQSYCFIGNGALNKIINSDNYSTILNGENNDISDSNYSTILNGLDNELNKGVGASIISSGRYNRILDDVSSNTHLSYDSIGSGSGNTIYNSNYTQIGNGRGNYIGESLASSIFNGGFNYLDSSNAATIVNGVYNFIISGSNHSTIISGSGNTINRQVYSLIIGGKNNTILGPVLGTEKVVGNGIINGSTNTIESGSTFVNIIGGSNNNVGKNKTKINILGVDGLIDIASNTTYVNNLDVRGNLTMCSGGTAFIPTISGCSPVTIQGHTVVNNQNTFGPIRPNYISDLLTSGNTTGGTWTMTIPSGWVIEKVQIYTKTPDTGSVYGASIDTTGSIWDASALTPFTSYHNIITLLKSNGPHYFSSSDTLNVYFVDIGGLPTTLTDGEYKVLITYWDGTEIGIF